MYELAELVKTIYATPLSSELAMKFFDDHSTLHYSIVQLPFGGRWTGSEDAAEYVRRWQATIDIKEMDFELENYDEAFGTFSVKISIQGRWKRSGQPASFSERHFGKLRGNKIRQLAIIALDVDEILSGYFTRSEKLFNKLMKSLLEHGVGLPTLELIADDLVYVRLMTRSNPEISEDLLLGAWNPAAVSCGVRCSFLICASARSRCFGQNITQSRILAKTFAGLPSFSSICFLFRS